MAASSLRRDLIGLGFWIALCFGVSALGALATASSVTTWYADLAKPSFTPPDSVFAPVWTVLYLMMAVAAWRVWKTASAADRRMALIAFVVQLALNLAWSVLFFGLRLIDAAAIEVVVLLIAILFAGFLFWRCDRFAGLLLVPYALWVIFASALTIGIARLN